MVVTKTPLPCSGIAALERSYCEKDLFATELFSHALVNALSNYIFRAFTGRVRRPTCSQSFDSNFRHSSRGKDCNATRDPEKLRKIDPDHNKIGHNGSWLFHSGLGIAFDSGPRTEQGGHFGIYAVIDRRKDGRLNSLVDVQKP